MIVRFKRKVNFYETDAQGIVHHSNYPRYFEEARGYYLENLGFPYSDIRNKLNTDIVILEININYRHPLVYGDSFEIITELDIENRYFFNFRYTVKKKNETISTGKTRHCCISRSNKKMIPIPDELRNKLD